MDNILATIILILAITGMIALTVYKMYKNNNNSLTVDEFLAVHYDSVVGALQDVVALLLINIDNYPDKESYEKAIINTTIVKLEENCDAFGISAGIFDIVNKDALTNGLYDILHKEKVNVFTNTIPNAVIEAKPELYDTEVIEASQTKI